MSLLCQDSQIANPSSKIPLRNNNRVATTRTLHPIATLFVKEDGNSRLCNQYRMTSFRQQSQRKSWWQNAEFQDSIRTFAPVQSKYDESEFEKSITTRY